MAAAGVRGLLITTEVVPPASIRRLMKLVGAAPDTMLVVDHPDNVRARALAARRGGVTLNVLVDVHVARGAPASSPAHRRCARRGSWPTSARSGSAGCRATPGSARTSWAGPRAARPRSGDGAADGDARSFEKAGLPVEIVAGGSTGTYDIDVELPGLTELQSGSYCVMDLDYRRSARGGPVTDFEMAITVVATVVSVAADRAMVDAGLKAFSTDKPFPPEAVERPGVELRLRRRRARPADDHRPVTRAEARRAHRVLPTPLRSDLQPLRPRLGGEGRRVSRRSGTSRPAAAPTSVPSQK